MVPEKLEYFPSSSTQVMTTLLKNDRLETRRQKPFNDSFLYDLSMQDPDTLSRW